MKTKNIGKILVIGLIILFTGASVLPSINARSDDKCKLTLTEINQAEPLFEGNTYFILLSDYTDGAGQENKWAVQLKFDSGFMIIECEYDVISLPLVMDQWTEIKVDIDLDSDWMEIFYNGTFLHEKEWTAGPNNGYDGELNIAAVDLYANGASAVFYDDLSLEEVGGSVVWSDDFSSYSLGQFLDGDVTDGGWKGWDNDPQWGSFVVDTQELSVPHSVAVVGNTDLIHEYDGYTSGHYIFTAWIYIPSETMYPPDAPTIDGTMSGDPGIPYDYIFTSVDPEGEDVKYYIDWGDGNTEVSDFNPSGSNVTISHTYTASGKYTIIAYAGDTTGLMGPSSTFQVTMPREKTVSYLFQRILERFPNAFLVLRQLLGL